VGTYKVKEREIIINEVVLYTYKIYIKEEYKSGGN
jgi:hypothetical protein